MSTLGKSLVCALLGLSLSGHSRADCVRPPSEMVRSYFTALGRNDFVGALALTEGSALLQTEEMIDDLQTQARKAHARVDVKLRALAVGQRPGFDGIVPVDATFVIEVVGHRWIFSRVARRIAGSAQFYVECGEPVARIAVIEGKIE